MKISKELIMEIKSKNDLRMIVSEYCNLNAQGWALCPFHNETKASFHIHPNGKFWKCFGCGKSGDVIAFVMEMKGFSFVEAIKFLAQRSGINLTINK